MDDAVYYYMPLFRQGVSVQFGQSRETVSHVVIRRNAMRVYLVGHDAPVHPDMLTLEPTAFSLARVPDHF
ncbi:hypothetical protein CBP34_08255 [Acidovorax carolinensis]|uniref:Uncharacterized protein n=2 Tax=Acidovorax carolinensis TaxID=553814 RepID=A0A240UEG3_9BURK|nr:hypothetical protein [Acidovorax carolinensis]ART53581.1 hypothetical protein CBP34_08255 [Acidovorax carolinensis]ART54871.1 hypothetical protein CBP35_07270 [Acidovorax carolinensis]ART59410.1 hypothetical protein CBP36_11655 [Acidovorax carolinensis]